MYVKLRWLWFSNFGKELQHSCCPRHLTKVKKWRDSVFMVFSLKIVIKPSLISQHSQFRPVHQIMDKHFRNHFVLICFVLKLFCQKSNSSYNYIYTRFKNVYVVVDFVHHLLFSRITRIVIKYIFRDLGVLWNPALYFGLKRDLTLCYLIGKRKSSDALLKWDFLKIPPPILFKEVWSHWSKYGILMVDWSY